MKIIRLQLHLARLPLKSPWLTAYGVEDSVETVLIKVYSENHDAWVETCPLTSPLYLPETAITVFQVIKRFFGPLVLGKEIDNQHEIAKLLQGYRGNSFAKAGVEQCWWALKALEANVPLHEFLGGTPREIPIGYGVGVKESIDDLLKTVDALVKHGAIRIKLKIKKGKDIKLVKAVRQRFPSLRLQVDCNGTYSLDDLDIFRTLDDYGLEMIEQPLFYRDLVNHSQLQQKLNTPICLDESITCLRDAEQAVKLASCRIICIKVGRVGGLHEAIRIHDVAQNRGVGCWIGSMMESGLGAAINVEFSTLSNCIYPSEITTKGKFHDIELVDPPLECSNPGYITPSTGPYLNRSVNENALEKITIGKAIID